VVDSVKKSEDKKLRFYWLGPLAANGQTWINYRRDRPIKGPFRSMKEAEQALDAALIAENKDYM
jgi:hypothetical protein